MLHGKEKLKIVPEEPSSEPEDRAAFWMQRATLVQREAARQAARFEDDIRQLNAEIGRLSQTLANMKSAALLTDLTHAQELKNAERVLESVRRALASAEEREAALIMAAARREEPPPQPQTLPAVIEVHTDDQADRWQQELHLTQHELNSIRSSTFWRMTAPARTFITRLRRARGGRPTLAPTDVSPPLERTLVVMVSHDATMSGAPIALLHVARAFGKDRKYEVVLLSKEDGPLAEDFTAAADHFAVLGEGGAIAGSLDEVLASYADRRHKLAICSTIVTFDVAELLKARGFTVVSFVHEMPAVVGHFGVHTLERLAAASDVLIFGANYVRSSLEKAFGLSHPRMEVVRTAIGDTVRPPSSQLEQNRIRLRQEAGFPESCFLVLGCGSIDHRKGVDILIEAADLVRQMSGADVRFVWIGRSSQDAYAEHCFAEVERRGLGDLFAFLPPRKGVDAEISAADLFALPSREDPFPLVNVSALALGVPVIAFEAAGGAPEVILPGAGVVVPNEDVAAFAEAIVELIDDPGRRRDMGAVGEQRYRSALQVERAVSRIVELSERAAEPASA